MSELTAAKDIRTGEVETDDYIVGNLNAMYQEGWQLRIGKEPLKGCEPYTHSVVTPGGGIYHVRIEDNP